MLKKMVTNRYDGKSENKYDGKTARRTANLDGRELGPTGTRHCCGVSACATPLYELLRYHMMFIYLTQNGDILQSKRGLIHVIFSKIQIRRVGRTPKPPSSRRFSNSRIKYCLNGMVWYGITSIIEATVKHIHGDGERGPIKLPNDKFFFWVPYFLMS